MPIVLFEDHHWKNLLPLTFTKATFDIKIGARTILDEYEHLGRHPDSLLVRRYLEDVTKERHGYDTNSTDHDSDALFINGLVHPSALDISRLEKITHSFAITSDNRLLVARLSKKDSDYVTRCITSSRQINAKKLNVDRRTDTGKGGNVLADLWDIIRILGNALAMQTSSVESIVPEGTKVVGGGAIMAQGVDVEEGVVLDTRKGGIFIGQGAQVAQCRITGPAYIGAQTQIKQFSIIESSFIGRSCKIAGEIEDSIISDYTNKAHEGFVGHSFVGEWVNLGAMTTTSDLKMTYGNIRMSGVNTGLDKLGVFIADMVKTSIGTLMFGGRKIGVSSHLHGLVTKDVPSFSIWGAGIGAKNVELELSSAIETQKRMMGRRGQTMSKAYEKMLRDVFLATALDRRKLGIGKTQFSI